MLKTIITSILILALSFNSFSQEESEINERLKMKASDRLIVDLFTDAWTGLPDEMGTLLINRGIGIHVLQDFPIGTLPVSVAGGVGFSSHNLYSDHRYTYNTGNYDFIAIPEGQDYVNNKLSLNYIDIPVELRIRFSAGSKKVRLHAGVKGGLLMSSTAKYRGDLASDDREVKMKEKMLDNIEPFLLTAHARLGYGRVAFFGQMVLNDLFTGNNAEGATFMSFGITYIVF
jgi:hypothetical protein